ncbi:unnamed protein product, partial [marine sediment metagenome]
WFSRHDDRYVDFADQKMKLSLELVLGRKDTLGTTLFNCYGVVYLSRIVPVYNLTV